MAKDRKIFVGSSSEARNEARFIEQVINKQPSMQAVLWNGGDAFRIGRTLLETIESLPFDYHGAVLLATPDVSCRRRDRKFEAPVPNVVFEYGYLAARLSRERVAICMFKEAEVPSDLAGMKVINVDKYQERKATSLPQNAAKELTDWLTNLPGGVIGIPAISQVHGYSGTWNVESRFSRWRGVEIKGGDKVFWEGKAFLVLQDNGERGSGVQVGTLYIAVGEYRASYEVVNEILAASVDRSGNLKLRVRVVRREGPKDESGVLSDPQLRQPLARKDFEIELTAPIGERKKLVGTHEYRSATTSYQRAEERWEYSGLVGPGSL
jgi:hypothetical protein